MDRRTLLGSLAATSLSTTAGWFALQTDGGSETNASGASGRGAADVFVHNVHGEAVSLTLRVEEVASDSVGSDRVPIETTVQLADGETRKINNELRFDSEYSASVSVDGGSTETATWIADSDGGLRIIYDDAGNVVFADEFA